MSSKKKSPTGIEWEGTVKEAWALTVSLITSTIKEGYYEGMEAKRIKREKKVQELEEELAKLKIVKQQKQEDDEKKVEQEENKKGGWDEKGERGNGEPEENGSFQNQCKNKQVLC